MLRFFSSIRVRLTFLFLLIFGSTTVLIGAAGFRFFVSVQQSDFDLVLYNHAVDVALSLRENMYGQLSVDPFASGEKNKIQPFSIERSFIQIRDLSQKVLVKSSNLQGAEIPLAEKEFQYIVDQGYVFSTLNASNMPLLIRKKSPSYRAVSVLVIKPNVPQTIIQLAVPMTYLERIKTELLWYLIFMIPAVLLIATFAGLTLSKRALSPVRKMTEKTHKIGVRDLTQRLPVPDTADEIQQLAITMNALLTRIEKYASVMEQFVANASHQLKTPLLTLKLELAELRKLSKGNIETGEIVDSVTHQVNDLAHLTENLLILARIDSGQQALEKRVESIDEIIIEVIRNLEKVAGDKQIKILLSLEENDLALASSQPFQIQCDGQLIKTMFYNIIENAVKYSPVAAKVLVQVSDQIDHLNIRVIDEGPGVQIKDKQNLFTRFYRESEAQRHSSGFGLGLAISKSIASLHDGTIYLGESNKGATFVIELNKGTNISLG